MSLTKLIPAIAETLADTLCAVYEGQRNTGLFNAGKETVVSVFRDFARGSVQAAPQFFRVGSLCYEIKKDWEKMKNDLRSELTRITKHTGDTIEEMEVGYKAMKQNVEPMPARKMCAIRDCHEPTYSDATNLCRRHWNEEHG